MDLMIPPAVQALGRDETRDEYDPGYQEFKGSVYFYEILPWD